MGTYYLIILLCDVMLLTYRADSYVFELAASSNGMSTQESTAQQMVSDPTLVHVLVRFLSGTSSNGTSQHSSQVGPTATQAMHEFLSRLQVHLSSTCPQMFSEFLLKLMHILSTERYCFQLCKIYIIDISCDVLPSIISHCSLDS